MFTAFLVSLFLSLFMCWVFIKTAPLVSLLDKLNLPRETHLRSIPRLGGLAIWLAITLGALTAQISFPWKWWISISIMGLAGLLDDWFKFLDWIKLILQLLAAICLWFFSLRELLPPNLSSSTGCFLIAVLWITAITYAIHRMDRSHGLCAGAVLITFFGIAIISSALSPQNDSSTYFCLFGALVGFLILNFPKGWVCLGNSGNYLLGVLIAVDTLPFIFASFISDSQGLLMKPLFLVSLPLVNLALIVLRKLAQNPSAWQKASHPLFYFLTRAGCTPTQAVLILWGAAVISVALAIII